MRFTGRRCNPFPAGGLTLPGPRICEKLSGNPSISTYRLVLRAQIRCQNSDISLTPNSFQYPGQLHPLFRKFMTLLAKELCYVDHF